MRKLALLAAILILASLPTMAQYEPPPMEVFGGISYIRPDGFDATAMGGLGEMTLNLSEKFALAFEVGVQKESIPFTVFDPVTNMFVTVNFKFTFSTVQTGFRYYALRNERFSAFGQLMTGGFFVSSGGFEGNSGAFSPGGGVEVNLSRKIAIRPVQVDLILASTGFGGSKAHLRYGGGIVYRFGE